MSLLPALDASIEQKTVLSVTPEKLEGFADALEPDGMGSFLIPSVLSQEQLDYLREEFEDEAAVMWEDTHTEYDNIYGRRIIQNHDTFALKVGVGDQAPLQKIPRLVATAHHVQALIRGLGGVFPVLNTWTVNELSLHHYDDPELGLSPHRDNLRYMGLVAVLNVDGESDLELSKEPAGAIHALHVRPGDLTLTRVSGIYPSYEEDGKPRNICPYHAVTNLATPTRTSFILRDNSRPEEPINGFNFFNWP